MAKYKANSPWFKTRTVNNQYLTLLSIKNDSAPNNKFSEIFG